MSHTPQNISKEVLDIMYSTKYNKYTEVPNVIYFTKYSM